MFRSKVSSILQTIVNRSSWNVERPKLVPCSPFSSETLSGDSTSTANTNGTSTASLEQSPVSVETSQESGGTIEASSGTPSGASTETATSYSSTSAEPELDKLYKKVEVEVRGNDRAVLQSYGEFAVKAAQYLDITVGHNVAPYKPIHERLTVLKSVHVHKKHRVQYETRTYYRYIDFFNLTGSTADTFLEYIQRNLPEGVAMKVTKVELQTLPDTVQQTVPPQQ